MDDLVTFLKARLDEDEAGARDALALWPDTHWTIDPGSLVLIHFHGRHDPARVLREVDAKRAIVRECEAVQKLNASTGREPSRFRDWLLRHLAAVYSGHPDYRAEWKP